MPGSRGQEYTMPEKERWRARVVLGFLPVSIPTMCPRCENTRGKLRTLKLMDVCNRAYRECKEQWVRSAVFLPHPPVVSRFRQTLITLGYNRYDVTDWYIQQAARKEARKNKPWF